MTLLEKGDTLFGERNNERPFEKIKSRLQRPPVLHLPDRQGQFQLCSDTSKFADGSALYQIQMASPNSLPM